jgi:hypothetical protein
LVEIGWLFDDTSLEKVSKFWYVPVKAKDFLEVIQLELKMLDKHLKSWGINLRQNPLNELRGFGRIST